MQHRRLTGTEYSSHARERREEEEGGGGEKEERGFLKKLTENKTSHQLSFLSSYLIFFFSKEGKGCGGNHASHQKIGFQPMNILKFKQKKNIILIDTANLVFRAAHSFKGISIRINQDTFISTGIIYFIINQIIELHNMFKPDGIIFVFEGDKNNNPRYKHPEYKRKRPTSKTIDITSEMLFLRAILPLMGVIIATPQTGEADDGIAYLAKQLSITHNIIIVSNDHDLQALLNPRVKLFKKNNLFTNIDFQNINGYPPNLFSLVLAVAGDASDNLPGIHGIGEKKCSIIIKKIIEQGHIPTPKLIAKEIKTYKQYILTPIEEIINRIKQYYVVTKLHPEWIATIKIDSLNEDVIQNMLQHLQMKQLIKNYNILQKIMLQLVKKNMLIKSLAEERQ